MALESPVIGPCRLALALTSLCRRHHHLRKSTITSQYLSVFSGQNTREGVVDELTFTERAILLYYTVVIVAAAKRFSCSRQLNESVGQQSTWVPCKPNRIKGDSPIAHAGRGTE
ncbi:hypothetical protein GX48_03751 [Paracoccidioides brasiliensis]|nr:hypothetical protein GX48_03751 [Paracoccidioides brasiliensis]